MQAGRKGEITTMNHHGEEVSIEALIPTRGLIGFETDLVNQTRGLAAFKGVVTKYRSAFPDCRLEIDDIFSAGDKVVVRWRYSGTHKGQLEGVAPTGRPVKGTGITINLLSGDRIREAYINWDALGLMQQLGVVTLPGKAMGAGA